MNRPTRDVEFLLLKFGNVREPFLKYYESFMYTLVPRRKKRSKLQLKIIDPKFGYNISTLSF